MGDRNEIKIDGKDVIRIEDELKREMLTQNTDRAIELPQSDMILQLCLEKVGVERLDGNIYFTLTESRQGVSLPNGLKLCVCYVTPRELESFGYEAMKRWYIGASLGYLTFGERFGLNVERYKRERILSDYVLADYLKFYGENWDPRDGYVRRNSPPRHMPGFLMLSEIWERGTPPYQTEMDRIVQSFWREDFGRAIYIGRIKVPFGERIVIEKGKRFIREMKV